MADVFLAGWLPNILSFLAGSAVTTIVAILIYQKQKRDAEPMHKGIAALIRKVESGSMTTDQAAREIIKGLETGALSPADLQQYEWLYKFCPDCKGEVEAVGTWMTEHGEGFGGTLKCKKCSWKKDFSG